MFELKGKRALVTGSSRGIGKAIAIKLAEAGADVMTHCRSNVKQCEDTAEKIRSFGVESEVLTADMSSTDEINAMFGYIEKKYGGLDILVNNAAILTRIPFLEMEPSDWDKLMETNARGYFLCSRNAARLMKKNGKGGRIINISSISQFEAAVNRTHYCATKGAIGMLTRSSALELAPYGITVNAVLPGSIHTDFSDDVLSDKAFYEKCRAGIPIGRIGCPEDIAGAVVFLASDEASYVTGAALTVDGGKTLE